MQGTPDPRPPGDDTPRERKRERFNTRGDGGAPGSDPLIHPDGAHPAHDFEGWLDRLIREARAAGVDDDALLAALSERTDRLQSDLGGEPEGEP